MTDQARFTAAIEANWPSADWTIAPGVSTDCEDCFPWLDDPHNDATQNDIDLADEGSFSWSGCDCCGSTLGGTRYHAHAIHREAFGPNAKQPNNVHHIDICTDCLVYTANGDLPESWEG